MIDREKAQLWIGKPVDLILGEYIQDDPEVDDPNNPDIIMSTERAPAMWGVLEKIDEEDGIVYLVLADNPKFPLSEGARAVRLDEVVNIEPGKDSYYEGKVD